MFNKCDVRSFFPAFKLNDSFRNSYCVLPIWEQLYFWHCRHLSINIIFDDLLNIFLNAFSNIQNKVFFNIIIYKDFGNETDRSKHIL